MKIDLDCPRCSATFVSCTTACWVRAYAGDRWHEKCAECGRWLSMTIQPDQTVKVRLATANFLRRIDPGIVSRTSHSDRAGLEVA